MKALRIIIVGFVMVVGIASLAMAQYDPPVIVPFTPSTPALASEVNQNFNELAAAVGSNDTRITTIENASIVTDVNGFTGGVDIIQGDNITVTSPTGTNQVIVSANVDGGNAQSVDGFDSTQFVRSDASDVMNGNLTLQGTLFMYDRYLYLGSGEYMRWDATNSEFYLSDDLKVAYNLEANYINSVYNVNAGGDVTAGDDLVATDDAYVYDNLYLTDILYFGGSTSEYLYFNTSSLQFLLSDDVYIYGNATTTGGATIAGDTSIGGKLAVTGEVNKGSGTANMIPIAYGYVNDSTAGPTSMGVSTGNVSVVYNSGYTRYEITIADYYYSYNSYVVVGGSTSDRVTTFSSLSGKLLVYVRDISGGGGSVRAPFYFVVYKP